MTSSKPKNISERAVAEALEKAGGVLSVAAEKLGCSRQNLQERVSRSKKLQAVRANVDDVLLDMCDAAFIKLIQAGDGPMCRWYAERRGKKRGYATSTQISFDPAEVDVWLASFGADLTKLRALRAALPPA